MGRIGKVNHQIQRIISQIIREEIDNPNLGMVSLVRVETTPDLRFCKVFFSVFPEENTDSAFLTLQKMRGFIRRLLGSRLKIRFLPDIEFVPDDSIKYSVDIYEKIERLKDESTKDSKNHKEQ
ncbi:MAG: 30S ribosome-binding factor RbfA [Candidatus Omnitrophica bacterium]|nr:30S ribosome-binding factor RbfA [Candidatus Omnitrophota bacterium]